jgi:hypothetical protein
MAEMASEYVTVAEAREILGVTKYKMTDLIYRGVLKTFDNEADRRSRLIRRADVEALKPNIKARSPKAVDALSA